MGWLHNLRMASDFLVMWWSSTFMGWPTPIKLHGTTIAVECWASEASSSAPVGPSFSIV